MANLQRQAAQLAQLQYLPEVQALLGLRQDAGRQYKTDVASAIGTAASLKAGARAAAPVTRKVYGQAEQTRLAANDLAAHVLAAQPADSPFRAAFGIESAGARTRFGEARAGALHELTQRALEADAGRAFDLQAAGQTRRASLGRIGQQLVGVRAQQGLATSTTLSKLRADAQALAVKQAGQALGDRNAFARLYGFDPVTGRKTLAAQTANSKLNASASKLGAGVLTGVGVSAGLFPKPRKLTGPQQGSALTQLHVAVDTISSLKGHVPSHALRTYLETGYTSKPQYADKAGHPVPAGTPGARKIPGTGGTKIPRIKPSGPIASHDIINAAFDIAVNGRLSRPNRDALRGVSLPPEWIRVPRPLTQRELQHGG